MTPLCHKFFEKGVCLRKFPLWKIVGPPWKEEEIRLEVDKKNLVSNSQFLFSSRQGGAQSARIWTLQETTKKSSHLRLGQIRKLDRCDLNNKIVHVTISN